MDAAKVLREGETSALSNNQIVSKVTGKRAKTKGLSKLKGFSAAGFITVMIVVFLVIFNAGTLVPSALSERLIEETDMQYADAVESKKIVFQQAMKDGEIPDDTTKVLKTYDVEVGTTKDGDFKEGNKASGELVLRKNDKIITADEFIDKVNNDVELYNAFNAATYSRAAYYYDESAEKIFQQVIGTSRHNYTDETSFREVMNAKMGSGSDVSVNNVVYSQNEDGSYSYNEEGSAANSGSDAASFVNEVRMKNSADTAEAAALNSADALKVAETTVREKRSSLFYSLIMEPISQMKAEDGNNVLNEMMNYLTEEEETEVTDVKTSETVKVRGSALDSPRLYAILSGDKVDLEKVQNYSNDRILKMVENQVNGEGREAVVGTVASTSTEAKGVIGRLIESSIARASEALVSLVTPTVSRSMVENSFEDIKGVDAGEFLVEGAVNTGAMLAQASGGTMGDAESITEYARLNSSVIAMDAAADRMNRSPFDVSSKNTFLGSILYKFAVSNRGKNSIISQAASVMSVGVKSLASLVPGAYADGPGGYLSQFGECETIGLIWAAGSPGCGKNITFDTSTLANPFGDAGFKKFVEENTTLSGGVRTINDNSVLARFILYNDERTTTPMGVMDGGILDSLRNGSGSVPLVSSILQLIESLFGTSDADKRIANGAAFVNTSRNADWQTYKYAQRYVSLARATAALKKYSNGSTAYDNMTYFEGGINPVIAYLEHYYSVANR